MIEDMYSTRYNQHGPDGPWVMVHCLHSLPWITYMFVVPSSHVSFVSFSPLSLPMEEIRYCTRLYKSGSTSYVQVPLVRCHVLDHVHDGDESPLVLLVSSRSQPMSLNLHLTSIRCTCTSCPHAALSTFLPCLLSHHALSYSLLFFQKHAPSLTVEPATLGRLEQVKHEQQQPPQQETHQNASRHIKTHNHQHLIMI